MSLVRHEPLTRDAFLAGVRALIATVARFKPSPADAQAILDSWLRIVFPACYGREHWLLALDRLMAEFKDMPKPADALEILAQIEAATLPKTAHAAPVPTCERPESDHTPLEWWIHNNPRKEGEGSLAYIDRIAVGAGLIPETRLK